MKYVLYAFCLFTLISCGSDDDSSEDNNQIICTEEIRPSFNITVVDPEGNTIEGATVTVIESDFNFILSESSSGVYSGPGERIGTYLLTIMREGFQDITITNPLIVSLTEDMCHVDTIEMTYEMQPL